MIKRFNPPVRITLTIIIYFISMFSCLGIFAAFHTVNRLKTDYGFLAFGNIIVGIVLSGAVFLAYRFFDKGKPLQLGFSFKKKDLVFVLVVIIISIFVAVAFIWGISERNDLGTNYHFSKLKSGSYLLLIMFGCIGWLIGTFQEEVLDRGYFFANLHQLGFAWMFLTSNIIFSITHIPTKGFHPIELLIHIVTGIGYGYVYYKSGSLWLSTIVHGFHNFLLDILFNNDYSVTLITFHTQLTDANKLVQQTILVSLILLITHLFYGKNGAFTPAKNLSELWKKESNSLSNQDHVEV